MQRIKVAMTTAIVGFLALVSLCAWGSVLSAPGYIVRDTLIDMPAYSFLGGFDLLPNGNFVINDGYSIREVSPSGTQGRLFYSYSTPVMGSFVRYHNGTLYFGESTTGSSKIMSIAEAGGTATELATLEGNFDLDFGGNTPYVVAGSSIYRLTDGGPVQVVKVDGYSGPLAFDGDGNLYYSPSYYPNPTQILKWTAGQLSSATAALTKADASSLAVVGGTYGFAFDIDGRLLLTNNSGTPQLQRLDGGSLSTLATFSLTGTFYPSLTFVRQNAAGDIVVGVSYYDSEWASHTFISTLTVPEPSSAMVLLSLIGLAASAKLLRFRGK